MDSRLSSIILRISKILKNITDRVVKLEKIAHPPRKFITCETCKEKVKENGKKR